MNLELRNGLGIAGSAARRRIERLRPFAAAMPEESGQSMLEFALVLPLFLTILLGLFAFGIAFNNWEQMTEATSVGARTVAISRGQTLDPCQTAVLAIEAAAPSLNTSNLTSRFLSTGSRIPASRAAALPPRPARPETSCRVKQLN